MNSRMLKIIVVLVVAAAGFYLWAHLMANSRVPVASSRLGGDFRAFFSAMDCARELGRKADYDGAEKAFAGIIETYQSNAEVRGYVVEARFELAGIYRKREQLSKAIAAYESALKSDPPPDLVVRARIALAEVRSQSGLGSGPLRDIFNEFRNQPEVSAKLCVELSEALMAEGEHAEAALAISGVINDCLTTNHDLLIKLAKLLSRSLRKQAEAAGDPGRGAEVYIAQLRAFPELHGFAWKWLERAGQLYTKAGKFAEARNAFNSIVRDYPGEADNQAIAALSLIDDLDKAENAAGTRLTAGGTAARIAAGEQITRVRGGLNEPVVWSTGGGTYVVEGRVQVGKRAELLIEAGTRVEFTLGASLVVLGRLIVKGTADEPVVFTSAADQPSSFDWAGVRFDGDASSVVEHLEISHAAWGVSCRAARPRLASLAITGCGYAAIKLAEGSDAALSDPQIEGNGGTGMVFESSGASVEGGLISRNGTGGVIARRASKPSFAGTVIDCNGEAGVQCFDQSSIVLMGVNISNSRGPGLLAIDSAPEIRDCEFAGNAGSAVSCRNGSNATITGSIFRRNEGGVECYIRSSPAIEGCTFDGNRDFGILCESGSDVRAAKNIFENLDGPGIVVKDVSRPVLTGNRFPRKGIAISFTGEQPLDVSNNLWPDGFDARKLIDEPGSRGRSKVILNRKP